MNPFEKNEIIVSEYIRKALENKLSKDSFAIEMIGENSIKFRASVFQVATRDGFKIRTRFVDGRFWIYILKSPHDAA